jgi:tripartite-type tricarboxylate transporter receptor subunit TctC
MTLMFHSTAIAFAVLSLPLAPAALAQEYPTKPIRIIVGPGPDILSRLFGQRFTDAWGQQAIIDQRPGAGGTISAEMTAKAMPDGYTLLMITSAYTINVVLQPSSYDLVKDFAPIALCATSPYILVVNLSVPARSLQELIALAKSKPGQINYASSGNGTGPHLAGEMLKSAAGINIVHVPYKAAGPAMVDVIAGQVQMNFQIAPGALSQVQAGKVRALAVTSAQRSRLAPDLPTVAESGYPGYEAIGWNGLVAPANTPKAIVAKLNGEVLRTLRQPAILQRIAEVGWEPASENSPEWFADYIKREIEKWAKVVKETGAKAD